MINVSVGLIIHIFWVVCYIYGLGKFVKLQLYENSSVSMLDYGCLKILCFWPNSYSSCKVCVSAMNSVWKLREICIFLLPCCNIHKIILTLCLLKLNSLIMSVYELKLIYAVWLLGLCEILEKSVLCQLYVFLPIPWNLHHDLDKF